MRERSEILERYNRDFNGVASSVHSVSESEIAWRTLEVLLDLRAQITKLTELLEATTSTQVDASVEKRIDLLLGRVLR